MAGGLNTPELASAVSNNGGVGSFGFAYSKPEVVDEYLAATKKLTKGPINCNFFVFQPVTLPSLELQSEAIEALRALPITDSIEINIPAEPFYPNLDDQLDVIWKHRPEILTFHFGLPRREILEKARALGIFVGVTATNLDEATAIQEVGADFIVAQGIEAGGHRGTFDENQGDDELCLSDLLESLSGEIEIPLVALRGYYEWLRCGGLYPERGYSSTAGYRFSVL